MPSLLSPLWARWGGGCRGDRAGREGKEREMGRGERGEGQGEGAGESVEGRGETVGSHEK